MRAASPCTATAGVHARDRAVGAQRRRVPRRPAGASEPRLRRPGTRRQACGRARRSRRGLRTGAEERARPGAGGSPGRRRRAAAAAATPCPRARRRRRPALRYSTVARRAEAGSAAQGRGGGAGARRHVRRRAVRELGSGGRPGGPRARAAAVDSENDRGRPPQHAAARKPFKSSRGNSITSTADRRELKPRRRRPSDTRRPQPVNRARRGSAPPTGRRGRLSCFEVGPPSTSAVGAGPREREALGVERDS